MYQDKITNIQDEREELENKLKKEYELKILHLETKWHHEKGEKDTLLHENEKLRQQLFLKDQELHRVQSIASGYSTGSIDMTNIGSVSIKTDPNDTVQRIQSIDSFQSVVIHTPRDNDQKSQEASPSASSSPSSNTRKSDDASSSSDTDSSSDDEDSSSSDSEKSTSSATSSDDDCDYDEKTSDNDVKHEGDKYTKRVINTDPKRRKKGRIHNRKASKRLNKKIEQNQPKGFWSTVWSLFGPPNLSCSCSDKNTK